MDRQCKEQEFFNSGGGCRVSYAHVVYSPEGIAPTVCSAHFQPLILEDEKDIDKH